MGPVEEKIEKIKSSIKKGITVKMRRADGAEPIKEIEISHNVTLVEFQDGEILLLTKEQFLNREIIIEEKEKIVNVEKRVEETLEAIDELRKRGYSIYYKGKKVEEIRKEGYLIIIRTIDGTVYTHKEREFLDAYKTAKAI